MPAAVAAIAPTGTRIAVMLLLSVLVVAAAPVAVEVKPAQVFVEKDGPNQYLNFDLVLTSRASEPLTLRALELSVLDRDGKVQLRKLVNSDGERPSIDVLGPHVLAPGEPLLVMNPFERLDGALDVSTLEVALTFAGKDAEQTQRVTIHPQPFAGPPVLLPLHGRWLVWDGHDFLSHHRRFDMVSAMARQLGFRSNVLRFAYDFLSIDASGQTHSGDEAKNESWFSFGQPIYAVADGTVEAVVDSRPDARKLDLALLKQDRMAMFGNYVVVRHSKGELALYGHIRQGSAKCRPGDKVHAGQQLASVGAAGAASVPHLHFELQNGASADAEGLPSMFRDFSRVLGDRHVEVKVGRIDSGDVVEQPLAR